MLYVSFIWKKDALAQLFFLFLLRVHFLSLVRVMVENMLQLLLCKF